MKKLFTSVQQKEAQDVILERRGTTNVNLRIILVFSLDAYSRPAVNTETQEHRTEVTEAKADGFSRKSTREEGAIQTKS